MGKLIDSDVVKSTLLLWEIDKDDRRYLEKVIDDIPSSTNELDCTIRDISQENIKLKAENERLKNQIKTRVKVAEENFNIYSKLELEYNNLQREIEQLESELEQSVKLPCKVGSTIYVNLPYQKPRNSYLREVVGFRYMDNSWFIETEENDYPFCNIGHSVFLTREEAEQHLKARYQNE